jgi:uncharacterized protein (TIGR02271 family)
MSTVVGVFNERSQAELAVQELERSGFSPEQVGFTTRGEGAGNGSGEGTQHAEPKGALGGAVGGTVIGGILGALATGLIPGVGPIIAGGILAGVLGGAAAGAAAGGIGGALMGAGVPEEDARHYESEVKSGRSLVTVKAGDREEDATRILRDLGATNLEGATSRAVGQATGTERMPLHEEQPVASRTPVEAGQVSVGKEVVSEQRQMEVPVSREEVIVERHPVESRPAAEGAEIGAGEMRVPVMADQVELGKRAIVTEEAEVSKRSVQDTQQVETTVHKEVPTVRGENVEKSSSDGGETA